MFETATLQDYYFVVETLRDTPMYTVLYFTINKIIPAIEGGFGVYEAQASK